MTEGILHICFAALVLGASSSFCSEGEAQCQGGDENSLIQRSRALQTLDEVLQLGQQAERSIETLIIKDGPVFSATAGGHQFRNIWVRDFCHSSIGLFEKDVWQMTSGQSVPASEIVATTLTAILSYTTAQGGAVSIPRVLDYFGIFASEQALSAKVLQGSGYLKSLVSTWWSDDVGKKLSSPPDGYPLQAFYNGEDGVTETIDSGYLILTAFVRLAKKQNQSELQDFLQANGPKLQLALNFYSQDGRWTHRDGKWLLQQGEYTEWKDSIKQKGVSSFTNLGLIEAMEELLILASENDLVAEAFEGAKLFGPRFNSTSPVLSVNLKQLPSLLANLKQWKVDVFEVFYTDSTGLLTELSPDPPDSSLSSISHIDAQLQWLSATRGDAELHAMIKIQDIVNAFVKYNTDGTIKTLVGITAQTWPDHEISLSKKMVGLSQYHGTMAWSWWTGWFASLAIENGDAFLGRQLLEWLSRTQADRSLAKKSFGKYVSEVYQGTKIVNNFAYCAETPFLWGSSYVYQAVQKLQASTTTSPASST